MVGFGKFVVTRMLPEPAKGVRTLLLSVCLEVFPLIGTVSVLKSHGPSSFAGGVVSGIKVGSLSRVATSRQLLQTQF